MFIVSIEYAVDLKLVDQHLEEHIEFLKKYYKAGLFLLSGRKVPRTGGVIMAKSDSKEELLKVLSEDPFYREELAKYEITEFVPSKANSDLEFLLETH